MKPHYNAKTIEEHKLSIKIKHNNKIILLSKKYINTKTKLNYKCKKCNNTWSALPENIEQGTGCPKCNHPSKRYTTKQAKNLLTKYHPSLKLIGSYKGMSKLNKFLCKECLTTFTQTFHRVKNKSTMCPTCIILKRRKRLEDNFKSKLYKIYKDKWVLKSNFIDMKTPVKVICKEGHEYTYSPSHLLNYKKVTCQVCKPTPRTFSMKSIQWLELIEKKARIRIRHAKNKGEVRIKINNTIYKVDGFNRTNKIIFEFYGDKYHGNLKLYKPLSTPHPFKNTKARKLFEKTIKREYLLKYSGYFVISCWEHDFNKNPIKCVNLACRKIQKIKSQKL